MSALPISSYARTHCRQANLDGENIGAIPINGQIGGIFCRPIPKCIFSEVISIPVTRTVKRRRRTGRKAERPSRLERLTDEQAAVVVKMIAGPLPEIQPEPTPEVQPPEPTPQPAAADPSSPTVVSVKFPRLARNRRPDPTPEEIERMCAEIRAGWDEKTYRERAGVPLHARAVEVIVARLFEAPERCGAIVHASDHE